MSDKPIQRGDLVMVVKPSLCCGNHAIVGVPFIVAGMTAEEIPCHHCKKPIVGLKAMNADGTPSFPWSWPVPITRLKRIDPPALKDAVPTAEELTV